MKIKNEYLEQSVEDTYDEAPNYDLTEIFMELQESYRNVFMHQIDNQVFFYRSLGRAEYKKILSDEDLTDFAKEEIICEVCVLWPQGFDFDSCDAGTPTVLTQKILRNSFLDRVDSRKKVLSYYREEMYDLDNQITCIINEAFPHLDIEEIEQWDVEKTTKYLSRAEWKLHNLRGLQFVDSTEQKESYYDEDADEVEEQVAQVPKAEKATTLRGGDKGNKLTPEKLRELQAKFPEINWAADTVANEGISGMADNIDVVAPALRPGS